MNDAAEVAFELIGIIIELLCRVSNKAHLNPGFIC
jgi:hypothetical protein